MIDLPHTPYPPFWVEGVRPTLIICGGVHPSQLTQSLVAHLLLAETYPGAYQILPDTIAPFDPVGILTWLHNQVAPQTPLLFLSFSAGVVGSLGAAIAWQLTGGSMLALIAVDGWGVPRIGNFPFYRLSHDRFTHQTSHWLGGEQESFYAEPGLPHLDLWALPDQAQGYRIKGNQQQPCDAVDFLGMLLRRYLNRAS